MLNAVLLSVHRCFAALNMTVAWWTSGGGQWRAMAGSAARARTAESGESGESGENERERTTKILLWGPWHGAGLHVPKSFLIFA